MTSVIARRSKPRFAALWDRTGKLNGLVLQDTWLFAGTIRDNIGYGQEDASDEEIVAAAQAAYVDDFVQWSCRPGRRAGSPPGAAASRRLLP